MSTKIEVDSLGLPVTARQLSSGGTSTNVALTVGIARISIYARSADIRYSVGAVAQTATSSSHYIAQGERLDINVPPQSPNIAVIQASGVAGTLEITELG